MHLPITKTTVNEIIRFKYEVQCDTEAILYYILKIIHSSIIAFSLRYYFRNTKNIHLTCNTISHKNSFIDEIWVKHPLQVN